MLVKKIYYPVTTLGPEKRIGIWTCGCKHYCFNCIAKDLWDFNAKYEISTDAILEKCKNIIDLNNNVNITISGGDPFYQPDLYQLLQGLKLLRVKDILVYTGFTYEEIKSDSSLYKSIEYIDVLVDGLYVENLNDNKPLRGSSNQRIIFFNKNLEKPYSELLSGSRKFQTVYENNKFDIFGIVPKNFNTEFEERLNNKNILRSKND